jgi:hypothetical protein
MLLFWSEGHLGKWLMDWNMARGAMLSLDQCWRLAQAWYTPDRRQPDWRRYTADETTAILSGLDLVSPYWRLQP